MAIRPPQETDKKLTAEGRSRRRLAGMVERVHRGDDCRPVAAQTVLHVRAPKTHGAFCIHGSGLYGDGRLEQTPVQIRPIKVPHLEDHEDPDGREGTQSDRPPSQGMRR